MITTPALAGRDLSPQFRLASIGGLARCELADGMLIELDKRQRVP